MNLTLASVDELIEELLVRCDDGVIVLRKPLGDGKYSYKTRQKGPTEAVSFLLVQTQEQVLREFNESWEALDPWEEF